MEIAIVFGFACQFVLLAFFAAHRWLASAEAALGRIVYGLGAVAFVCAVAFAIAGQPWSLVLAFALYATWAAFGCYIDIIRPIPWRQPPRLSILLPYAGLLIASLLAFWIPLWWVDGACASPSASSTRPTRRSTWCRTARRSRHGDARGPGCACSREGRARRPVLSPWRHGCASRGAAPDGAKASH